MAKSVFGLVRPQRNASAGSVIDKLELRIPRGTPWAIPLETRFHQTRKDPRESPWRRSPYYGGRADLRPWGISAIVHDVCTIDKRGDSKLELMDTGEMSWREMRQTVKQVYYTNPDALEVMRVDLAADIEGVTPRWFLEHMRVRWRQWVADLGKTAQADIETARMGRVRVETLYFGKRPNTIRVYDKVSCWKSEYRRLEHWARQETLNKRAPGVARICGVDFEGRFVLPPFEDLFHWPSEGRTLTRVERQIAGGRVPKAFDQFGLLRTRLADFNPFARCEVVAGGEEPTAAELGPSDYLKAVGLRYLVERDGFHRVRMELNRHGRHAGRLLDDLARFLPAAPDLAPVRAITAERLYTTYRDSVRRQLAA